MSYKLNSLGYYTLGHPTVQGCPGIYVLFITYWQRSPSNLTPADEMRVGRRGRSRSTFLVKNASYFETIVALSLCALYPETQQIFE